MLEQIVRKLVSLLLRNRFISQEEYEQFVYVLLGDIESFLVIISILFIGTVIGQIVPTASFLICFFALRKRTGGYNLSSYYKCYIGTVCLYVFIAGISYLIFGHEEILIGCAVVAGIVIMYIGNVNHPNMNAEEEEVHELKKMSRIIVILELLVIFFLNWLGNAEMVIVYSGLAIILCAALLVIAKLIGQEVK